MAAKDDDFADDVIADGEEAPVHHKHDKHQNEYRQHEKSHPHTRHGGNPEGHKHPVPDHEDHKSGDRHHHTKEHDHKKPSREHHKHSKD
ncbi:hypothetical protein [Parendozoicomonas haliclonae]|uniref:Cation diffusion facilitator family transporter n=1 Tax=Parendozoicomonas haliclonae TaxID=1960125 RepID=A0A1X7AI74_9GAMM|nr:hypothetical protein [Parendozoicomonas haliclonae]SMA42588.1 hypothetical protein EHSB41UT_01457 [Parendozoicomonas haliclonae]